MEARQHLLAQVVFVIQWTPAPAYNTVADSLSAPAYNATVDSPAYTGLPRRGRFTLVLMQDNCSLRQNDVVNSLIRAGLQRHGRIICLSCL